ncbi:DUF1801 domain-containing protein [uncultured Leifsonia sp.]|uniref:DUF1801 domain-containing protein n=1 Tax=uncultured Leifsonia sp. TaxID=340359 RepID=UPI0028D382B9|nr:DUF1801 domain-containing protein [uncultured Leifsonia sp.]
MFSKKGDAAALANLAGAPAPYREIAERLHAIIRETAPALEPVVRWGLPFYVRDGKDVCYIKTGADFLAFGFGEDVNPAYREGASMHPIVWNITALDPETEATLRELIRKAAG